MVDVVCNVLVFIIGGINGVDMYGVDGMVVCGLVRMRFDGGLGASDKWVNGEPVVYRMVEGKGGGLSGSWCPGMRGCR